MLSLALIIISISAYKDKVVEPADIGADIANVLVGWHQGRLVLMRSEGAETDELLLPPRIAPLMFQKIPVNQADSQLLETISGIGPELASRILATRQKIGRFDTAEDLLKVPGIGDRRKIQLGSQLLFE